MSAYKVDVTSYNSLEELNRKMNDEITIQVNSGMILTKINISKKEYGSSYDFSYTAEMTFENKDN